MSVETQAGSQGAAAKRKRISLLRKIVAGGPGRPTRLHTERGEVIPASELRHLPRVMLEWTRTKLTGNRPDAPWWPMPVIPIIETFLASRPCDVVEFGSGGSTRWLSARSRSVAAIEDNPRWFEKVRLDLEAGGYTNATISLRSGAAYHDLSWAGDGVLFDLAIVDGSWRWLCVEAVLPRMKPGGIIYLDNSDADKDASMYVDRDMRREAQRLLEAYAAAEPAARLQRHAGLISGEVHAGEGMVLRLP